jgi:hypothetical protein
MAVAVRVEALVLGRRRAGVDEHELTLEIDSETTLRDLISIVVSAEVEAFEKRREQRTFVRVLTDRAVAEGEASGAIRSGGDEAGVAVDIGTAIGTALLAFDDGLFQVYVDDEPIDALDATVSLRDGSRLVFLRLVALAGG